jgi:hypothetical protein
MQFETPVHIKASKANVHKRRIRRQICNGERLAAVRALSAVRLHSHCEVPTLAYAARACGSNIAYCTAMKIVLAAQDANLLKQVLRGNVPLLIAARQVKPLVNLIKAYDEAANTSRAEAARRIGVARIWDEMLVPVI